MTSSDKPVPPEAPVDALASLLLSHGNTAAAWASFHDSLKAAPTLWGALAFDGIQADGRGGYIELRRCPACQSTLARPIARSGAEALMAGFERIYLESLASLQAA